MPRKRKPRGKSGRTKEESGDKKQHTTFQVSQLHERQYAPDNKISTESPGVQDVDQNKFYCENEHIPDGTSSSCSLKKPKTHNKLQDVYGSESNKNTSSGYSSDDHKSPPLSPQYNKNQTVSSDDEPLFSSDLTKRTQTRREKDYETESLSHNSHQNGDHLTRVPENFQGFFQMEEKDGDVQSLVNSFADCALTYQEKRLGEESFSRVDHENQKCFPDSAHIAHSAPHQDGQDPTVITPHCGELVPNETSTPNELLRPTGIELYQDSAMTAVLPRRPGYGRFGKRVILKCNLFSLSVPDGNVYHYDVNVKGPKRNSNAEEDCESTDESSSEENVGEDARVMGRQDKERKKYRCLNTKDKRKVIEDMLETDEVFKALYAAYDGEKNLYTRKPIPATFPHIFITNDDSEVRGRVKIKPVKKKDTVSCAISLDSIHTFYNGKTNDFPLEAFTALETILRHIPCLTMTPIGRSFFSPPGPNSLNPVGGGVEIWYGWHQSTRPGEWGPTVNINITATTFYTGGPVLNRVAELLNTTVDELRRIPRLKEKEIKRLSRQLKDRRIEATHSKVGRKYTVLKLSTENAHQRKVDLEVRNEIERISVAEYFLRRYNTDLKFPNLPCLQVKPEKRNVFLPLEVCHLLSGQHYNKDLTEAQKSEMIKFTSRYPKQRFQEIDRIVRSKKKEKCLREFELEVCPDPLRVEGRTLDPPSLMYGHDTKIQPKNGSWTMRDVEFFKGVRINSWVIVNFTDIPFNRLNEFCNRCQSIGRRLGVEIGRPSHRVSNIAWEGCDMQEMLSSLRDKHKADLIVAIIHNNCDELYRSIKKSAETIVGLITNCVKERTVWKITDPQNRSWQQLVTQLFLKINSKLEGTNYSLVLSEIPQPLWEPTIVIGADVTHPGGARGLKYSIASCAGSLDARCSKYTVRTSPQINEDSKKKAVEIILDLKAMVMDLLRAFYRHNRQKPQKIIFYRDGVSEGELKKVLEKEVLAVRLACHEVQTDYEPGITFIVVQKRHHVRFAPEDTRDSRDLNVPPGTVIDRDATHKDRFDFYLGPQWVPKGTARLPYYTVLADDNHFSADDIQKFTHQLTYTQVRCTKSVSIPSPIVYADRAAYRAMQYMEAASAKPGSSSTSSGGRAQTLPPLEEVIDAIQVDKELKNRMYFV